MSNVSTEQRLRLVQQVRSRYNENRYDMYNRERILYGRASYPEELEPGDPAVSGMGPMDPSMPVSTFRLRLLLAVLLFAAVVAMDINQIDVSGVTAEKIIEAISMDYEDKIDEWVAAFSLGK